MSLALGLLPAQISFDMPLYLLFLFAAASVALGYLMYRKVVVIASYQRVLLLVLRSLSFFLVLLGVTNLTTELIKVSHKKHDFFVLVDDSKSMSLLDGAVQRARVVKDLVHCKAFQDVSRQFDMIPIVFGDDILKSRNLDSLKFDQPFTNIESSLLEASRLETNAQAAFAILLTDGNYNEGGNPIDVARGISFPIYAIGVGDSVQPKDVAARELIPSPSIYAGKKSVVRAVVSSYGFAGKSATARLMEDGKAVDSKQISLSDEGNIEVSFSYTPEVVGTHLLTVHVAPQSGEINQRNNSISSAVEVLKGKYSVLLVAGEPASDVASVRRNIEANEDFDLRALVQKNGNEFYRPTADGSENKSNDVNDVLSKEYDAVLLYDFPNTQSSGTFSRIQKILNSAGVAYVYLAGKNFSPEKVAQLPRLPFAVTGFSGAGGGELQIGISPVDSTSSLAELQPIDALLTENSGLIPPLYYQAIDCKPVNAAASVAFPVLNGVRMNSPVFVVSESGRSAAFLAYGLWRAQLMGSISGLRGDFLQDLLATLVKNLINSGKQRLLTVGTDKKSHDPSETVNINALLVDQAGSPISGAAVDVNVRNESTKKTVSDIQLDPGGDGSYRGKVGGLGEGKYAYYAQAKSGSGFLGADSGTIVVESLNKEFVQTAMNGQFLRQLATVTGGQFLSAQEFIDGKLPIRPEWKEPVALRNENRFELLSSLPVLVVVIVLLGVEWVMRKIWGLP
jgi:hypothetical protein